MSAGSSGSGPVVTSSRETLDRDSRSRDRMVDENGHRNAVYYLQQPPRSRDTLPSTASTNSGGAPAGNKGRGRVNLQHVPWQPDPNSAEVVGGGNVHIKLQENLLLRASIILVVFSSLLLLSGILEASLGVIQPYYSDIWCSIFILITGVLSILTATTSRRILALITLILCGVCMVLSLIGLALTGYVFYWYDVLKTFCVDSRRDERYFRLTDAEKHLLIQQCTVERPVPIIAFVAFYIVDVVAMFVCLLILVVIMFILIKAFRGKQSS
ncbi:uncharacterized protein LOC141914690 [Tubulanus polymorphus]|uniref:uncharacterized protein LOC141914690 n=1 Tax=Tubulanus polymorphus TaxID=672921 RepID=UPI003DA1CA12